MLSRVENKGIKITAIVGLVTAFAFTGLFGLTFVAGCIIGDMLGDAIFKN